MGQLLSFPTLWFLGRWPWCTKKINLKLNLTKKEKNDEMNKCALHYGDTLQIEF